MVPTSPVVSQPSVAELVLGAQGFAVRAAVVRARDPRAAHLQLARRLAVPGQTLAAGADQPGLDAGGEAALGDAVRPLLVRR